MVYPVSGISLTLMIECCRSSLVRGSSSAHAPGWTVSVTAFEDPDSAAAELTGTWVANKDLVELELRTYLNFELTNL